MLLDYDADIDTLRLSLYHTCGWIAE